MEFCLTFVAELLQREVEVVEYSPGEWRDGVSGVLLLEGDRRNRDCFY